MGGGNDLDFNMHMLDVVTDNNATIMANATGDTEYTAVSIYGGHNGFIPRCARGVSGQHPRAGAGHQSAIITALSFSLYLLPSCHHRVLDIWALTFTHIRNCVRASQENTANTAEPIVRRAPKVQLGSFMPSTSTVVDLGLSLMSRSASRLEGGIPALIDEISAPSTTVSCEVVDSADSGPIDDSVERMDDDGLRSPSAVSLCRAAHERAGVMVSNADAIR
ncbi:hypothetical protein BBP40_003018 [Aspergillus hancockii]|nr:hypothetical protein BBP40_003018 [Aspergillus hancockii]